jgi:hypothetical protein
MIDLKTNLNELTVDQLLREYGLADFTYIETSNFLEELENYRQTIHNKIKEKQHEQSQSMGEPTRN